jgi:dienelactone hydrolase
MPWLGSSAMRWASSGSMVVAMAVFAGGDDLQRVEAEHRYSSMEAVTHRLALVAAAIAWLASSRNAKS